MRLNREEEDREVERILAKGKEAKRKLATAMYEFNVELVEQDCTVQYSTYIESIMLMSNMLNSVTLPYIFSCENCGSRAQDDHRGMGDV